jgi:hypothetical protein
MASITPNPKKRGYLLPPGCKDLIDLLQPRRLHDLHGANQSSSRAGEGMGRLTEIEKYVTMVFESRALAFLLVVAPPDGQVTVRVARMEDGTIFSSVMVQKGTDRETAVRGLFTRHGLPLPKESGTPETFYPHLPIYLSYDIPQEPLDAPLLARLASSLFREVCGLTDDSELSFHYDEITKPS